MKLRLLFNEPVSGRLSLVNAGKVIPQEFASATCVEVSVEDAKIEKGAHATVMQVEAGPHSFSFFVRDVTAEFPLYSPLQGVAVTLADDGRDYAAVAADISSRGLISDFEAMNKENEESFANACEHTRKQPFCPVWLGMARDPRFFRVSPQQAILSEGNDCQYWGVVTPYDHSIAFYYNGWVHKAFEIMYEIGPGCHVSPRIESHLMDGCLPIVESVQHEGAIDYQVTQFATLENHLPSRENVKGVEAEVCYPMSGLAHLDHEEWQTRMNLWRAGSDDREEVLLVIQVKAVNVSSAPAYAWFKAPHLYCWRYGSPVMKGDYDIFEDGLSSAKCTDYRPFAVSRLNGRPLDNCEEAVLIQPGETVVFDMIMPHQPMQKERAQKLFELDVEAHLQAAREYWRKIVFGAAQLQIPEKEIEKRYWAGIGHLNISMCGEQEQGPLLATVGNYAPIGTESSPFIQFLDSIGCHREAERCLDFFLDHRQLANGYIQCYSDYESETGPVVWTAGEHFLYTQDVEWLKRQRKHLEKSCEYLLEKMSEDDSGLASGKTSDPEDRFHSFFLNAINYLGLERMVRVLPAVDPEYAEYLAPKVEKYRSDIIKAVKQAFAVAPLIPTGDGTWVPALSGWPESVGANSLYVNGGAWMTHGIIASRDALNGPLSLSLTHILPWDSPEMTMMLAGNQCPFTMRNAAMSQPYYSRHDYAHLMRNEVKLYLKTFYNQVAALQDRSCLTFWEHLYCCSTHKTHEEAWFLMQLRWMLFVENGNSLELFKAAPRAWFDETAEPVNFSGMCSHWGKLSCQVKWCGNRLRCRVESEREPEKMVIRLPHPQGKRAVKVSGGAYEAASETVTVTGRIAEVELEF